MPGKKKSGPRRSKAKAKAARLAAMKERAKMKGPFPVMDKTTCGCLTCNHKCEIPCNWCRQKTTGCPYDSPNMSASGLPAATVCMVEVGAIVPLVSREQLAQRSAVLMYLVEDIHYIETSSWVPERPDTSHNVCGCISALTLSTQSGNCCADCGGWTRKEECPCAVCRAQVRALNKDAPVSNSGSMSSGSDDEKRVVPKQTVTKCEHCGKKLGWMGTCQNFCESLAPVPSGADSGSWASCADSGSGSWASA